MLLKLLIENYALIDKLEIGFSPGLTVITGETGAGKSILVGALSLILGERADSSLLADPNRKCIVEGTVLISQYGLGTFFKDHDIDYEEHTIIRREISSAGKSRAFVNDVPVSVNLLKELGERLISIHSQHAVLTISDPAFQLAVIDDFAGIQTKGSVYRTRFRRHQVKKQELEDLKSEEQKARNEREYHQFMLDELVKAGLKAGEQEEMERQQELLSHAEEIKTGLLKSIHRISADEVGILASFSEVINILTALSEYHPDIKVIVDRTISNQVDIKDILSELQHIEPTIFYDPEEGNRIAERLDLIYRLEKKHGVDTVEKLIALRNEISDRVAGTDQLSERILTMEKELDADKKELMVLAREISNARKAAVPGFEKEMVALLNQVGMPSARFRTGLETSDFPGRDGLDRVRFLFSANKGVEPADLGNVASGGELSRLMLSVKSLITRKNLLPTVIFDEIDNGISGEVAGRVGTILRKMAERMQVIAITHLPQIAGKGEAHLRVYKKDLKLATRSMIAQLSQEERVEEIARMLSSEKVSDAAVMTARELMKH